MHRFIWMLVAALSVVAASAHAQNGSALVTSNGCTNCHAVDQQKVGPAFSDIAAQYSGNAAAEGTLIAKLRDGNGHMKVAASEADIKAMVDYVLVAQIMSRRRTAASPPSVFCAG